MRRANHVAFDVIGRLPPVLRIKPVGIACPQKEQTEPGAVRVFRDAFNEELPQALTTVLGGDEDVREPAEGARIGDDPGAPDLCAVIRLGIDAEYDF